MRSAWLRGGLILALVVCPGLAETLPAAARGDVVVHEIAWMGTSTDALAEWVELRNNTDQPVLLDGWSLESEDQGFVVGLSGWIQPQDLLLLERGADDAVPCVAADLVYPGGESLANSGEVLTLRDELGATIDRVDGWHAGTTRGRATMERVDTFGPGDLACNWATARSRYCDGLGTPGAPNSRGLTHPLVINEVAWTGTADDAGAHWVELANRTRHTVDLAGWSLEEETGGWRIALEGTVSPFGLFLLERKDEKTVGCRVADQLFFEALAPSDPGLLLRHPGGWVVDRVESWMAGDLAVHATMERAGRDRPSGEPDSWQTAASPYCAGSGLGTPGRPNAAALPPCPPVAPGETVSTSLSLAENLASTGPSPAVTGPLAAELVQAIAEAGISVDFALHEVRQQDGVLQALRDAQDRGVRVRCVLNSEADGTLSGDGDAWVQTLEPGTCVKDENSALMHSKFFVFDGARVWTGSANVTGTGTGGEYNHNHVVVVESTEVAAAYTREFEEMYLEGLFQRNKTDDTAHVFCSDGPVRAEVYFAPSDAPRRAALLPLLRRARDRVDAALFFLTEPDVARALAAAHQRGVEVRVLMDAVGAASPASLHTLLCDAGVPVKIENWGGKEHQKAAAVDGEWALLGSMNWTRSGAEDNDENTLLVRDPVLAGAWEEDFQIHWEAVPELYRCNNPGAETMASGPQACSDGVDNDFDGFVDGSDVGCGAGRENTLAQCTDGEDNDGDGWADASDFDCDPFWPEEADIPSCNDGLDNDGDGAVDLADPECAGLGLPAEILATEPFLLDVRRTREGVWMSWTDLSGVAGLDHYHLLRARDPSQPRGFQPVGGHLRQPAYEDRERRGGPGVRYYLPVAVGAVRDPCDALQGEVEGPTGR